MKICQIACMSQNRAIGKNNKLPWHLPEDLKFFKKKTTGHPLIMGRKTFESLSLKPLPHRLNIIITRNKQYTAPHGVFVFHTIKGAIHFCEKQRDTWGDEVYIGGGAEIYHQTLSMAHYIYLTIVHKNFKGDTFFPKLDPDIFKEINRENYNTPPLPFSFFTYKNNRISYR